MKPPSFRLKIAVLSTVISGLVLVGFGVVAFFMISKQKLESLDTEIRSIGTRHPGLITNRRDFKRLDEALGFIFGDDHRDQVILMVKDAADGNVLYTSSGWPKDFDTAQLDCTLAVDPNTPVVTSDSSDEGDLHIGRGRGGLGRGLGPGGGGGQVSFTKIPKFQTIRTAVGEWRLGMLGTADISLIIGLNSGQTRAELDHLRNAFLFALPLALALVGVGGWLVAGRALRPMRLIASTAELVTARGLDQRIPMSNDDPEIARVILVLNRMMDRLENSFEQAIRFSADASHELKTPLAIMQGELENALQEASPGSREQQVFSGLLDEAQRLKTITRGLLLLARADSGQLKPAAEILDLTSMVEAIVEDTRVLAEEMRLGFEVDVARQRQVDGVGLGLSLAREIARAHGGELDLQESRPGWTSFVLRLNA